MKVTPHASEPNQPTSSCQNSFLTNKHLQMTLFVIGILGMVLGSYYLQGIPRIVTVAAGALIFALFLISKCLGSCCANSNTQEMDAAPSKKSTPAAPPPPPTIEENLIQANKLGAVLLNAIKDKKTGIKNVSHILELGSKNATYHQGYRVDFRVDGHLPFSGILCPEIDSQDPKTIIWAMEPRKEQERLIKVLESVKPDQKLCESFFIGIIEGTFPQFQLCEIPEGTFSLFT